MEFLKVINERYSCKKFSDKPVSNVVLQEILEAARVAPTAKNLQEQKIYVLTKPEDIAVIDEVTPCRYGAPIVLVVAYDAKNVFVYPGGARDSGVEDASIVATHLCLAATNAGVNTCWINNFDPEKAKKALQLPENEEVLMFLNLGYAAEGSGPLSSHQKRKPLEETVVFK